MTGLTIGDGLAALAFWGFVAVIVVSGILFSAANRRNRHETLQKLIESGQPVDHEMIERLISAGSGDSVSLSRGLRVAGIIVLSVAPGIAVLGLLLQALAEWALYPLLGAALIVGCTGFGLLVAAMTLTKQG